MFQIPIPFWSIHEVKLCDFELCVKAIELSSETLPAKKLNLSHKDLLKRRRNYCSLIKQLRELFLKVLTWSLSVIPPESFSPLCHWRANTCPAKWRSNFFYPIKNKLRKRKVENYFSESSFFSLFNSSFQ